MFCAEWSLVKHSYPDLKVIPLHCKCWHCDECRPSRTQRLIHEAKRGLPTLFITLTSRRRADRTASWAAQEMVKCWRRIRREYIEEHGPGSIPFLAVFEETKEGWPHLHIVARARWIDQKWLSDRMAALHDSPIVDVRRVDGLRKVAAYVAKYIGKNPHRFEGVKRYWRSLDFLKPEEDERPVMDWQVPLWTVEQRFWRFVADDLEAEGWYLKYRHNEAILSYGVPP